MTARRKISIRKILQVLLSLVVTTGCIVLMVGAAKIENNQTLKGIEVHINNGRKYHFIEQQEVMNKVINNRHIDVAHTPVGKLDIHSMEQIVRTDPWVADAQLYIDNAHTLHMYVTQRIPVARIFDDKGNSYYLDSTLNAMPLTGNYVFYTTVVTNVPELKDDSMSNSLKGQIVSLVRYIEADSFWNAQIAEIMIDSNRNFTLLPVIGNQKIVIGDTSRMHEKFDNLFTFYKKVSNRIGWDKYDVLDVRFKGQVIASPSLPWKGPVDKAAANINWVKSIVESDDKKSGKDTSLHMPVTKPVTVVPTAKPTVSIAKSATKPVTKPTVNAKTPQKPAAKPVAHAKTTVKPVQKQTAAKQPAKPQAAKANDKSKNNKGKDSKAKDNKPKDKKKPKYILPDNKQ